MDRAHRIGQTKAVTVYRLVTRNSIEERMLSLQQFKLKVAAGVVTADNADVTKMRADQLTQFLSSESAFFADVSSASLREGDADNKGLRKQSTSAATHERQSSAEKLLQEIGALWDESQYEEYSAEAFAESLEAEERADVA